MAMLGAPRVLWFLLLLLGLCSNHHSVHGSAYQEIPVTTQTILNANNNNNAAVYEYEHEFEFEYEKHDDKWKEEVARNRRFLTRKSRESFRQELEVRNRRMTEEEQQQEQTQQQQEQQQQSNQQPREQQRKQEQEQERRDLTLTATGPVLNVLVCLMQWTNHPDRDKAVPVQDYDAIFNNDGRDATLFPGGTVKDYFDTISYGDFTMNFEVTPWIMTDYTEQQYTADGSQGRTQEIQDAFAPVLEWLDDDFYDFKQFDSNYDRKIDLTIFLHSGYDGSISGTDCETGKTNKERVASHARTGADVSDWVSNSGYRLGAYVVSSVQFNPQYLSSVILNDS